MRKAPVAKRRQREGEGGVPRGEVARAVDQRQGWSRRKVPMGLSRRARRA